MNSARQEGQARYAAVRLERALQTIRCTGPGVRNVTFNTEVLQVARLVAARLLDSESTQRQLLAAATASGMGRAEAQATLRSAFRAGLANPAFDGERVETERRELPIALFDAVVSRLAGLCPIESQPDVCRYVWSRGLPLSMGGMFALPGPSKQRAIIAQLEAEFGAGVLEMTGLFWRKDWRDLSSPIDLGRFAHPNNRWCLPWRDPSGLAFTLQRRIVAAASEDVKRWVFASGRQVNFPLGAEVLWPAWKERARAVIIAEGPGDTLALRAAILAKSSREGSDPASMPIVVGLSSAVGELRSGWLRVCIGHEVKVALDGDAAGEKAAQGIIRQLAEHRTTAVRMAPPAPAKDWGEALLRYLRRHAAHASELEAERAERTAIEGEGEAS